MIEAILIFLSVLSVIFTLLSLICVHAAYVYLIDRSKGPGAVTVTAPKIVYLLWFVTAGLITATIMI